MPGRIRSTKAATGRFSSSPERASSALAAGQTFQPSAERIKEYRDRAYEVYVRQMYKEEEVGRVTWRLTRLERKERAAVKKKTEE
jgi:hypothetical protein